jgi:hypothetical protein
MFKYIEQLRQKPEGYRKRFAFFTTSVLTLAIFGVWITTLPSSIDRIEQRAAKADTNTVSPVNAARQNLGTAIEGIKGQFDEAKEEINEAVLEGGNTLEESPDDQFSDPYSDFNQGQ